MSALLISRGASSRRRRLEVMVCTFEQASSVRRIESVDCCRC